jgi:HSP20 family protein
MFGKCYSGGFGPAASKWASSPWATGNRRPKYNVPMNVIEHEDQYEVQVFALGFDKANIKLTVVDDVLYISGTREVAEDYRPNFSRQEYPVKSFERMLDLNGKVATTQISAVQVEGVLTITLPKTPEARSRVQEVPVG